MSHNKHHKDDTWRPNAVSPSRRESTRMLDHHNREQMSGLDPIDNVLKKAYLQGLLLHDLFTKKFWKQRPMYIVAALAIDLAAFTEFWVILIIISLILLIEFIIDLIRKMIWRRRRRNLREKYNHHHLTRRAAHIAYRLPGGHRLRHQTTTSPS